MTVQQHLHLATTLSGAPEFAPVYQWRTVYFSPIPSFIANVQPTQDGSRHLSVVHADGAPLLYQNYEGVIIVEAESGYTIWERRDQLLAMLNRTVYFVPYDHPDDGQDHSAAIKQYFFANIEPASPVNKLFVRFEYQITLLDHTH